MHFIKISGKYVNLSAIALVEPIAGTPETPPRDVAPQDYNAFFDAGAPGIPRSILVHFAGGLSKQFDGGDMNTITAALDALLAHQDKR